MTPRKKGTGEVTRFLQCVHCSAYLLSQPSVMKHLCRNSSLNQNQRNATINEATATRSVKISFARVALKRLTLDAIRSLQSVNVIKKRGRPGRPKGKKFLSTEELDPVGPKLNRKAFSDDRSGKPQTTESNLKKTRICGISKVLKNLGVDNLDEVEKLTRTPRRCNIATKEKLESHYKNTETDNNDEDNTNVGNAIGKKPKIATKPGRPRKNRVHCEESGDEDKIQTKRNYYPGKEKRAMDIFYVYKCSHCPAKFRIEKEYILHMKTVHDSGRKTLACPVCAREFIKRTHLGQHIDRHISAESNEKALNLMEKWPKKRGNEPQLFSCKFCLVPHPHQFSFLTHMKEQHFDQMKTLEFSCPHSCAVKTNSIKGLIDHIKSQHKAQFYGRNTLNTLRRMADPPEIGPSKDKDTNRKYKSQSKCDICGKMLVSCYLKEHKKTHEKILEKAKDCKFQCPICSRGFKDRFKLRKHFMLHLENNPYVCRFGGCGQKFQDEKILAKHVELHYDYGPSHTCDKCGVTFRSSNHKCVTDPKKIKIGADGRKYARAGRLKVKRVSTELGTLNLQSTEKAADGGEKSNGDLPAAANDECRQEKMEVESVHFVDKIIETEDGPIHLKGERLSPEKVPNDDNDRIHSQQTPAEKQNNTPIPAHENTLLIIVRDPVYQRLVKENPEFETLIKGRVGKAYNQDTLFKCSLCSCAFLRYWSLDLHIKKKHGNGESNKNKTATNNVGQDSGSGENQQVKLMCGTCGFHAGNGEALEHHMKTAKNHGSNFKHRCTFGKCGTPFKTSEQLTSHVQRVHLSDTHKLKFKCGKCGTRFATAVTLRRHKTKYHAQKKTWKCLKCDKAFVEKVMLEKHKTWHQRSSLYKSWHMKCEICEDVLSSRQALKRHIRRVHLNHSGTYKAKSSTDRELTVQVSTNPSPPGTDVTAGLSGSVESESHNSGNATDKSNEILGL